MMEEFPKFLILKVTSFYNTTTDSVGVKPHLQTGDPIQQPNSVFHVLALSEIFWNSLNKLIEDFTEGIQAAVKQFLFLHARGLLFSKLYQAVFL